MKERKQATKAIILARVSTKEQVEGYSIDAQKYRLEEYCTRRGLEILKIFEFSESSTRGNRDKFKQAIEFAKSQKEVIAIISDKVDRLQRSYKETPMLNDLIERERIELHFYTENCVIHKYSTSQEKMMWNMFVMMAQSYVDSLKDNVNRSIAQKLREGEWISIAPIGYLHEKASSGRNKGKIVVDEMRAPLIRKLFEEYATGIYTLPILAKKSREWGLKNARGNQGYLLRSHMYDIITNPFYYGVMRIQKTGKEYPHIYMPIISKELFDQCQKVRLGWSKKPFKWGAKEFIFRGLIKCATTGRTVTSFTKKKTYNNGNIGEWTYLQCWNPKQPDKPIYVKEEEVIAEIQKVLDSMHLEPESFNQAISCIKKAFDAEKDFHKRHITELNTEHTKIQTRINKLTDLFLDGDFSKEEYEIKRKELIEKRQEIVKTIEHHNEADNDVANTLIRLIELASRAGETFRGSNFEEKRKLINLVFWNLELNGCKLVYTLRSPFDTFIKTTKTGEWWA
jgi:site-specific DNA recombinase